MRKLALILAMAMLIAVLPVSTVMAAEYTQIVDTIFDVNDTVTELSVTSCTATNRSQRAIDTWSGYKFLCYESSGAHRTYQGYKLNVETEGTYKVEVLATMSNVPTGASEMGVFRKGMNSELTSSTGCGDVMLTSGSIKGTTSVSERYVNDLGLVNLEKGETTLYFSALDPDQTAFYVSKFILTRVDNYGKAPIVLSFKDCVTYQENSGKSYGVTNPLGSGNIHSIPYIVFNDGEIHTYDLKIPEDGYYSFKAYKAYSGGLYTISLTPKDAGDEEAVEETIIQNGSTPDGMGDNTYMGPCEFGRVNIKAGEYTMKLTHGQSDHYAFMTITRLCDEIPYAEHTITDNKTLETVPTKNWIPAGKQTSFSWMNWNSGRANYDFGYGYLTRTYVVTCEKEGLYDFILTYRNTVSAQVCDLYVNEVKTNRLDIAQTDAENKGVTGDLDIGVIYLNKGENTIRFQSVNPSGTDAHRGAYYLNKLTLTPNVEKTIVAKEATNASLFTQSAKSTNTTTQVTTYYALALKKPSGGVESNAEFTVNMEKSGYYNVRALASSDLSEKTMKIKTDLGGENLSTINGDMLNTWKYVDLGYVYFSKGEQTLSVGVAAGTPVYLKSLVISSPEVVLQDANGAVITEAKDGTIKATAYLDGMFDGKTVRAIVAVYDGNSLAFVNDADVAVADKKVSVTLSGVSLEEGKTYTTKVFVWDDMRGIVKAF